MPDKGLSSRIASLLAGAAIAVWGVCATADTSEAQVADAGGVQVVANDAPDRLVPLEFRERFRLGAVSDGPDTFFRVFPWSIGSDVSGHIYVLDVGDARVGVFDSTGKHVRDLGRRGGGPGEFILPTSLAVSGDGIVAVGDQGKRAVVRFTQDGKVLEQIPIPFRASIGRLAYVDNTLVVGAGRSPLDERSLNLIQGDTAVQLAALHVDEEVVVTRFPDCPVGLTGVRPLFAPTIVWAASGSVIAVNDRPPYAIDLYREGSKVLTITRPISPVQVTQEMAENAPEVRNGMRLRWPGGECRVSRDDLLKARGFARTRSRITDLAVAPNGTVWVRRIVGEGSEHAIDLFGEGGKYLGTLPHEIPFPSTFALSGDAIVLTGSEFDTPMLVIYQILNRHEPRQ